MILLGYANFRSGTNYGYQLPKKEQRYLQDLKDKVKFTERELKHNLDEFNKWQQTYDNHVKKVIAKDFKINHKQAIIKNALSIAKVKYDKSLTPPKNPLEGLKKIADSQKIGWHNLPVSDKNIITHLTHKHQYQV